MSNGHPLDENDIIFIIHTLVSPMAICSNNNQLYFIYRKRGGKNEVLMKKKLVNIFFLYIFLLSSFATYCKAKKKLSFSSFFPLFSSCFVLQWDTRIKIVYARCASLLELKKKRLKM